MILQESFNVLDCGIYRVISRRGSQSEEETGSFINQSASEEERLKEFALGPEEDQGEHGKHLAILRNVCYLGDGRKCTLKPFP